MNTTAILGTVGIPASYGGFETLAENLVRHHQLNGLPGGMVVYCSAKSYPERMSMHLGAELRYINLKANGAVSVLYDALSLVSAVRQGCTSIVLLGVSGAVALPFVRLLSRARIVTNVDGIEWKRAKWTGFARFWLRLSERWAVRFSHVVVADNQGIAQHIEETYGRSCAVIAYGGDHAIHVAAQPYVGEDLPERYALGLCRIEPENNVEMILSSFASMPEVPLVFIGNWQNSAHGRELFERFSKFSHLRLLEPIYDLGVLHTIRRGARLYVHGHSAGGTNPSLVEMMHFGRPVLAYDCVFNRFTTEGKALFFASSNQLRERVANLDAESEAAIGRDMLSLAQSRYTWQVIGREYFRLATEPK